MPYIFKSIQIMIFSISFCFLAQTLALAETKANTNFDTLSRTAPAGNIELQNSPEIVSALERLATRMENSPIFTKAEISPNVLVDKIVNRTRNKALNTEDFDQIFRNYIFNKTSLKILPTANTNYDLLAKTSIKSLKSKDGSQRYFVYIELYDKSKKLKGFWSEITQK